MANPELTARCEKLAAAQAGEFRPPTRLGAGGYETLIVVPPGAPRETADLVFHGQGNTADDAMRSLLQHAA